MTNDEPLQPVFGSVRGDTLVVLVLARSHEPVAVLAQQLLAAAAARVAPFADARVVWNGQRLSADRTLHQCALPPLAYVQVLPGGVDDGT